MMMSSSTLASIWTERMWALLIVREQVSRTIADRSTARRHPGSATWRILPTSSSGFAAGDGLG